eukprot:TRINITY_DN35801_c0_g1_i1.p1 TRINITY_DN35801_c0_g1~~TRINITY_DN35801_c0_g1_i1.p1  ORF type:complete len:398 (+),score=61.80 TRINITY_DN35801_c0_g1_i1:235-1428(+)
MLAQGAFVRGSPLADSIPASSSLSTYGGALRSLVPSPTLSSSQVKIRSRGIYAQIATGEPETASAVSQKVRLGQTGVDLPALGIGAWSWGDKFYWNDGEWDDRKLKNAKSAFDGGMDTGLRFFDTAEVYGTSMFGEQDSEQLLGRFIQERERRQGDGRPAIATKYAPLPWRLGRKTVTAALKQSLDRLRVPSVELYQIHWAGIWGNEAYIDGLGDCVEQGLTKAVGVSNFSADRLRSAHAQLAARGIPLASNQVNYSLLYRLPEENEVKRACEELGVTLIAYSPLAQGMLSGKYNMNNPPTGPRATSYPPSYLAKLDPLLKRLKEIGSEYGKTPVQVSLNWLIAQGGVLPIPGAKTRQQAEEFAGALGWSLTPPQVAELRSLAAAVPRVQPLPVESS